MAQTTSLVFNGGVIPSPAPGTSGSGKAKLLKIGEITVTEQEVQVTKKVICDPDSITTVAPFMEVLTSAKLAELISANSILVLDDGTVQYLMADATVVVEDGTAVCTAVNFLGLSKEDRAKILYPCTRITDELTLQQVLEVGEPVETGFDLVKAYPEDTEAGTLIDKLMVEDTVQGPDDQPLLEVVQGDGKVAINEDNLRRNIDDIYNSIDNIGKTIDEMDMDSVPRAYLASTLNQSPGDSVTTRTTIDVFSVTSIESDCFEFEQTTTIDDTPFGYVWIEPGTYLINAAVTLQWVGNPRGTFIAKVGSVMGENFDFSQEQEISRQSTKIVTIPNRMKLAVNVTYDAGTPVMGFWIKSMQVVKLSGGMSQTNITHDNTLVGQGSVAEPLGVTTDAFGKVKDIPTSISQFRNGDVIPVDGPNGPAKMPASELQDAILGGPIDEAVQQWLDEHPEATTTVEDGSLTESKFSNSLKSKTIKDYVTPEMFGAIGDGVTNDFAAIDAMFASGHKYFLFTKTYKLIVGLTGSASYKIPKGSTIIGKGAKIIAAIGTSNSMGWLLENTYVDGFSFENLAMVVIGSNVTISNCYTEVMQNGVAFCVEANTDNPTISGILFENCTFAQGRAHAFGFYGWRYVKVANRPSTEGICNLKNISFINCKAYKAGYKNGAYENIASCGFAFKRNYTQIDNISFINCFADSCGEDGFHFENDVQPRYCKLIGCVSNNNGKWNNHDYGAGFLLGSNLDIKMIGCYADGNICGFCDMIYQQMKNLDNFDLCINNKNLVDYVSRPIGNILFSMASDFDMSEPNLVVSEVKHSNGIHIWSLVPTEESYNWFRFNNGVLEFLSPIDTSLQSNAIWTKFIPYKNGCSAHILFDSCFTAVSPTSVQVNVLLLKSSGEFVALAYNRLDYTGTNINEYKAFDLNVSSMSFRDINENPVNLADLDAMYMSIEFTGGSAHIAGKLPFFKNIIVKDS